MSSATFCTSAPSSSCNTLTLIPVSSLKGFRFAAIAVVGEVFSETKLSVVPANWFHMPPPEEPDDADPPPHPAAPSSEAPARPAPVILRNPLRENVFRIRKSPSLPRQAASPRRRGCNRRCRQKYQPHDSAGRPSYSAPYLPEHPSYRQCTFRA